MNRRLYVVDLLVGIPCTAYATELASSDVSVYTLMKLLFHESMTTSQRYLSAADTETRSAAARNPIYGMITTGG
jgi:integrase/recombinase XerC